MAINTPRDIAKLMRWYRADDYDPDGLGHWPDHSLNGWNRIDVAAGSPTLNATGGPNSNPAVELDGSTDRFAVGAGIAYASGLTIIAVAKRDASATLDLIVSLDDGVSPRIAQFRYGSDSLFEYIVNVGAGNQTTASKTGTMTDWNILSGIRRSTEVEAYVNGASDGAQTYSGSNLTGARTIRIGSYGTSSHLMDGSIAEVLVYNKSLSDPEHDDVLKYLADAHNMSVTLSDTSTYNGSGTRPSPAATDPHHLWWDGAWTRNLPHAVHHDGASDKTYVAFGTGSTGSGVIKVMSIDHDTGTVVAFSMRAIGENLHASPALHVRADGKLLIVYTGHNSDMWQRISTSAEDISAWGSETTIDTGDCTYPTIVELSDRIVLHYRQGSLTGDRVYRESTDGGDTWGSQTTLMENGADRPYMTAVGHPTNPDRIDYIVTDGHPNEVTNNSLYHFYRDDVGSGIQFFKSDGTLMGGVADLPFQPSDATLVWDAPTEGNDAWDWDIGHDGSGNPVALFEEIVSATSHIMQYATWNGSSWTVNEIVDTGGGVNDGGLKLAAFGAAIDRADARRVWVSAGNTAGTQADLYEYITNDGGSTWSNTQVTDSPHGENSAPAVPTNRHDDLPVLWLHGNQTDFDDFNLAVWYLGSTVGSVTNPPSKPTILSVAAAEDRVTLALSSSFVAGDGGTHAQSRWSIRRKSDQVHIAGSPFTSSVYLESFVGGSLVGGTTYEIAVEYQETPSGEWSTISDWFEFTTLAPSTIRYVRVVTGDRIWMAGRSRKQNPSDTTTLNYLLRLYDGSKNFVRSVAVCIWPADEEIEFRQGSYIVQTGEEYAHVRATSVLDDQRRGIDFLDGGINAPDHGISAALIVNTPNAGFQWESEIQCRVRYVMNTTGHVSSQEVDVNGAWANSTHATSGTEDNALTGIANGDPVYLTIVGYDNPNDPGNGEHRRSPRLLVGPITASAASSLLLTTGDSLIQTDGSNLLLTG